MQTEPTLMPGIVLSDYVIREAGSGKLSLIGCFQRFSFPQFPARMGRWFATVGISNIRGDVKELNVTARIEIADSAHVIASTSAKMQFQPESPQVLPNMVFDVPLPFKNVTFQNPGRYVIVVLVDTEEVGRRPLEVLPVTQSANPQ